MEVITARFKTTVQDVINDTIALFAFVETISDFLTHFKNFVISCMKRLHCFKYTLPLFFGIDDGKFKLGHF